MTSADHLARRLAVLASPAFILALTLLLTNDLVLKPLLHDWFTGKFSDFTGLFVCTSLLLAAAPRRPRSVSIGMALAFAWWKSPLSQPFIDFCDTWLTLPVHRVVDYTDLLALLVLPPAWSNFRRWQGRTPSRFIVYPAGLLAVFAVSATSMLPPISGGAVHVEDDASGKQSLSVLYAAVDAFAAEHGMTRTPGQETGAARDYRGNGFGLALNYDPETRTLFYALRNDPPYPDTAATQGLESMEQSFIQWISTQVPGVRIESGKSRSDLAPSAEWQMLIGFPAHRFTVTTDCENAGIENADLRLALAEVESFAAAHGLTLERQESGASLPCFAGTDRTYLGGRVVGPYPTSLGFKVWTHAQFGLRGTTFYIELEASRSLLDQGNALKDELQQRMQEVKWQDPDVDVGSF